MPPSGEVDCNKLATYLSGNCKNLIKVLRFFVLIGATSVVDKLAHASSAGELRKVLSDDVARVLESIRRSARVEGGQVVYREEVGDRDAAYYRSLGVLREEGGKKYVVVAVPGDPDAPELRVVEEAAEKCGVMDVASTLALLARTRPG